MRQCEARGDLDKWFENEIGNMENQKHEAGLAKRLSEILIECN